MAAQTCNLRHLLAEVKAHPSLAPALGLTEQSLVSKGPPPKSKKKGEKKERLD